MPVRGRSEDRRSGVPPSPAIRVARVSDDAMADFNPPLGLCTGPDDVQYATWWGGDRRPYIAERALYGTVAGGAIGNARGGRTWHDFGPAVDLSTVPGDPLGSFDPAEDNEHESIIVGASPDGHLHVVARHHFDPLHYVRTTAPGDLRSFAAVEGMVVPDAEGTERQVTYPQFFFDPGTGDLYVTYRSSNTSVTALERQVVNRWDARRGAWERVLVFNAIDEPIGPAGPGGPARPYTLGLTRPMIRDGVVHLAWTWFLHDGRGLRHDLSYATFDLATGELRGPAGGLLDPRAIEKPDVVVDATDDASTHGLAVAGPLVMPDGGVYLFWLREQEGSSRVRPSLLYRAPGSTGFDRHEMGVTPYNGVTHAFLFEWDGRAYMLYQQDRASFGRGRGQHIAHITWGRRPYRADDHAVSDVPGGIAAVDLRLLTTAGSLSYLSSARIGRHQTEDFVHEDNWTDSWLGMTTVDLDAVPLLLRGGLRVPRIDTIACLAISGDITVRSDTAEQVHPRYLKPRNSHTYEYLFARLTVRASVAGATATLRVRMLEHKDPSTDRTFANLVFDTPTQTVKATEWLPLRTFGGFRETGYVCPVVSGTDLAGAEATISGLVLEVGRLAT